MESNWRWNLWRIGIADSRYRLAARFVLVPQLVLLQTESIGGYPWVTQLGTLDTGGYLTTLGGITFHPGPGFPYGNLVEPD